MAFTLSPMCTCQGPHRRTAFRWGRSAGGPFGNSHVEATRGTVKPFFAVFKNFFPKKSFWGRVRAGFGAPSVRVTQVCNQLC